jgi:hypothetical protein
MYKSLIKKYNIGSAILVFLVIFIIFAYLKPHFLYSKNGALRTFGLGKSNSTILPIWLFAILLAILSYLLVLFVIRLQSQ